MTTLSAVAIVAVPPSLALLALLVFDRRHIHGQMEQIAEAAEARAAARSQRAIASNSAQSFGVRVALEAQHMQDATSQAA